MKTYLIAGLLIVAVILVAVALVDMLLKRRKPKGAKKIITPKQPSISVAPEERIFEKTVLMDESEGDLPDFAAAGAATLRYIGREDDWPRLISVSVSMQRPFTIGREDISLGQRRCDYEFPAQSRAVSRKHVEISRDGQGNIIRDLGSKAGTYVNGVKLESNEYYRLENGAHISFGTAGANYIWTE